MTRPVFRHRPRSALVALALVAATVLALPGATPVAASQAGTKPTVVLVHGAFADASGWTAVSKRLQSRGYPVLATANPLRSVDGDAAYLASILATIDGPVVLVGHSYGGVTMTNAATGNANVRALVYVAAFAPAQGETVQALTAKYPGSGLLEADNLVVRPHPGGADGYISPSAFRKVFCADLPKAEAAALGAAQRPADVSTLSQPSGAPAWETIPSWYVVATQDKTIPPAIQREMAERMDATTTEVKSSHVVMMSHPKEVTAAIVAAAKAS